MINEHFRFNGCQTKRFYGEDCSLPCPNNCQEGHCHIVDGTCLGCSAGYKGATCENGMHVFLTIHYNSYKNKLDASFITVLAQFVFLKKNLKCYEDLK